MDNNVVLNSTWLHSKYENGEINVNYSYVSVNEPEFFAQGNKADQIIEEIYNIWVSCDNCTNEDAFNKWIEINL